MSPEEIAALICFLMSLKNLAAEIDLGARSARADYKSRTARAILDVWLDSTAARLEMALRPGDVPRSWPLETLREMTQSLDARLARLAEEDI